MSKPVIVDARGLSCPEPAMMTSAAIATLKTGAVEVLVDSGTARDNCRRLAERFGWRVVVEDQVGGYRLALSK